MEEIDFKVWLKPHLWDEENNIGLMTTGLPLGGWKKWWINLDPLNKNNSLDGEFGVGKDIEILQFSNLFDVDGKKLYKGDIIELFVCGQLKKAKIVFKDGCFGFSCFPELKSFDVIYSDFEVFKKIGNVYENINIVSFI